MNDSLALRLMERLELFLYRKSAAVVAVTESFKRDLVRRGIHSNKIYVVTNGVDLSRFKPVERDNDFLDQVLQTSGTQVIPSKLFECMGMDIPVLHGVAGESAEIVEREDVGLVFESENPQFLCDCLLKLASDSDLYDRFQENCLAAAPKYDRTVLARKMLKVLEGVGESGRKSERDNDRDNGRKGAA